jgi:colicin import membrane protein
MQLTAQAYPMKWPAAALALGVHAAFFLLLVLTVSWQKTEAPSVTVDLWTDLPAPVPKVTPTPPPPQREVKPAPKAEPKFEPKPAPAKPDIALKAKKPEKEKPKPAPPKVDPAKIEKDRQEKLQNLIVEKQRQLAAEEANRAQGQMKAAQEKELALYKERIINKIRPRVNRSACGSGNPELKFDVSLLPTGQLQNNPILRKSSGIPACDKAVETAILQSEPLPVPARPELFERELNLTFKPNE